MSMASSIEAAFSAVCDAVEAHSSRIAALESRLAASDLKALKLEGEILDLKRAQSETNCELLRLTNAFLIYRMEHHA